MTVSFETNKPFPRGAIRTPTHRLMRAEYFSERNVLRGAPPQVAYVPKQLSYWGNNNYGVCVTSEEAFAKACYNPEIFIPDSVVIAWARKNGVLNGASLDEVLDWMVTGGFVVGGQRYNDGGKLAVDYSKEDVLRSAIAQGPVKVAIAGDALPSGAGNNSGWYALGNRTYRNTDHCVSLCGYGPAEWLYQQLGVTLPSALAGKQGYLLFTWSTIGFVDYKWIMGTVDEAWVRNPTTVGVPPLPDQPPVDPPVPPVVPPVVPPTPVTISIAGELYIPGQSQRYIVVPKPQV